MSYGDKDGRLWQRGVVAFDDELAALGFRTAWGEPDETLRQKRGGRFRGTVADDLEPCAALVERVVFVVLVVVAVVAVRDSPLFRVC